ncbi:DNA damage-inducible transcript 3 protein [Pelodytes ibericus]
MMAESLPFFSTTSTLAGWELEAWYEDLEDILCSDTKNAGCFQAVKCDEQSEVVQAETSNAYQWTLEPIGSPLSMEFSHEDAIALEAVVDQFPSEVLELLNSGTLDSCSTSFVTQQTENVRQSGSSEPDHCYSSSPAPTLTEDEESSASSSGTKRKRTSQPHGGKVRVKEREHENENEKKAAYLEVENERLKGEIERLSMEVEKTRKALIERMVNLKKP